MEQDTIREGTVKGTFLTLFKCDRRTRVWAIRRPNGDNVVIKQYVYSPLKQKCELSLGVHLGQEEIRGNRSLAEAGVPVVPIEEAGCESWTWGCRVWLMTPLTGRSLQKTIRVLGAQEPACRRLVEKAATLTVSLLEAGMILRDLKTSNIVVEPGGEMLLIDAGGIRRIRSRRCVARMLKTMDRSLVRDGMPGRLREHFRERVRFHS